jgi:hypothetical protein
MAGGARKRLRRGDDPVRDTDSVPLICPSCQVIFGITENANAGNHMATVHGVVFDVFGFGGSVRHRFRCASATPDTTLRPSGSAWLRHA